MGLRIAAAGIILYKPQERQETNKLQLSGIEEISRRAIRVQTFICDGQKNLWSWFVKWKAFLKRPIKAPGISRFCNDTENEDYDQDCSYL